MDSSYGFLPVASSNAY